jgi:hypothetical protein
VADVAVTYGKYVDAMISTSFSGPLIPENVVAILENINNSEQNEVSTQTQES